MIKDLTSFISGVCFIILSFILFHEANQLSPFASVFPLCNNISTFIVICFADYSINKN
jgi:hypothetical protein